VAGYFQGALRALHFSRLFASSHRYTIDNLSVTFAWTTTYD